MRASTDALETANRALRQHAEVSDDLRHYADSVLRALNAGVLVADEQLRVRTWNRWNENAWGLRAEEVLGEDLLALDIGLPLAGLRDDLVRLLAGELPHSETTLEGHDRRGHPVRCRVRLSPLVLEGPGPRGVVVLMEA